MHQEHGQSQGHEQGHSQETDRQWAKRMADERELRDRSRHEELKQVAQVTQSGVAKTGVDIEEMKAKMDAIFEKTCEPEPTTGFGKFVARFDAAVRRAVPYVTVGAAAVATGYGVTRGVKYLRGDKKPDATIMPVVVETSTASKR